MKKLVPNMYQKSIYTINYDKLKKNKIKCLLFDLDNTCAGYRDKGPSKELKELFTTLTKMGFKVIIFSNSKAKKLAPYSILNVVLHPSSKKPFKKNFQKLLNKYHYQKKDVCIIGDQLFTDILGGNSVGIKTCLVDPLTPYDFVFTKIFRASEQIAFKSLAKKNILIKGEYYE